MEGPGRKWRLAPHVAFETFDREGVALDLRGGTYFRMNEIAARAWKLLEKKPRSVQELVDSLAPDYEVARDVLDHDLEEWLEELARKALVVEVA